MLPLLGLLYAIALIDRTNLGIARTAGMDHDLHLSIGNRYSIISFVYFIPYTLLQFPSNIILRKLGVSNWLTFCTVSWGAVQLAMGFVPSWKHLVLCRALLGAFEAGFFPALVFVITTWYTRHEIQKRLGAFYLVAILTGGFSPIFAYVLTLLGGKRGISAWAWIFIVEGAITILFGLVSWFFIPDFPDQNKFLTEEETKVVLERVEQDRGDSIPDELTVGKVLQHLGDWKMWAFAMMYFCATIPAYAIGFFVTIILRSMGWSVTHSLLLSAPPYIFAAMSIMFFAWLSDKYRQRATFIALQTGMTLLGLFLTGFMNSASWRYFGIFLANGGSAGCIPGILAYSANNTISHSKRAVSTAIIISFGGIGGIFATTVFRQVDFPHYTPGIYASIGCQLVLLILLAGTTTYFRQQNRNAGSGCQIEGRAEFVYTL
ncbi:MFS general substrate transporter [Macrolepiota fuliginosa MF-IS2]|uniref:MFS general substrate transporter n=1 Tax=Macrolepiota fuliginosa MF-IS2 TaxID=1400762 RepID=A0A9P5XJI6_9AGAR|nr:MFS general substrate transporter [Macrolepiota fuliginosa MF-IS2]